MKLKLKVSTRGTIALPKHVLEKLGIRPGDTLIAGRNAGRLVLEKPLKRRRTHPRIVHDPLTGFPTIDAGRGAPVLTNEMVNDLLEGTVHYDF